MDGENIRTLTGDPIPYQAMWKDPERFSTSLIINNTITLVGQQAFRGWSNATSLTIPNSVEIIHPQAFQYWYVLPNLVIPESVTEIWEEAFADANSLTSITVLAQIPPDLKNVNAFFSGSTVTKNFYVPAGSLNAYKTAQNWSAYASQIFAIP